MSLNEYSSNVCLTVVTIMNVENSILCNNVIMLCIMTHKRKSQQLYTSSLMYIIIMLHTVLYLRPCINQCLKLLFNDHHIMCLRFCLLWTIYKYCYNIPVRNGVQLITMKVCVFIGLKSIS